MDHSATTSCTEVWSGPNLWQASSFGGVNKDASATNEVYKYNERSRKWKRVIPPLPTARFYPSVLSLKSALVVAGGDTDICDYTDVIEIFKLDKSQ